VTAPAPGTASIFGACLAACAAGALASILPLKRSSASPQRMTRVAASVLARLPERDVARGHLHGAKLLGLYLEKANLAGADLSDAELQDATIEDADFEDVDLKGANLSNAKLTRAKLARADLKYADLSGTNLSQASGLRQDQLAVAVGSALTKLPASVQRPRSWPPPRE
jgi:Pentapeptide repeats (8 copies)